MTPAPEFARYPLGRPPIYKRWLTAGAVALVIVGCISLLLQSVYEQTDVMPAGIAISVFWAAALLVRILFYRFNRHVARCYEEMTAYVLERWWRHRRQQVALVESVLVAPACNSPEQADSLFTPDRPAPAVVNTDTGLALRMPGIFGANIVEREHQLARLLALQWGASLVGNEMLKPVQCYWQGSPETWRSFVEQMNASTPHVQLPEQAESWLGMRSLDVIIDRVQGLPVDARILCGGCHSTQPQVNSRLPAGEVALLWLLSPSGGVRMCRGEGYEVLTDDLSAVAERAQQHIQSVDEQKIGMAFSQPDVPELAGLDWGVRPLSQDAHFGELAGMQAMVVQTLAAWHAQRTGAPCLWLASDPHYALALGVIEADESC